MRSYLFLTLFVVVIGCNTQNKKDCYTQKYDSYFRKYSKHYFSVGFDWRWFKAQAIAESALREKAKSWSNAKGIMQLLPSTFEELCEDRPEIRCDIYHPRWNIAAGICYDRKMWVAWRSVKPFQDHLNFTFASYNAGIKRIMDAQKCCQARGLNEKRWSSIVKVAHEVRGWRCRETIAYITRIKQVQNKILSFN